MSTRAAELAYLSVLRFSGADALAFLQGQVSNDTRRLADGLPLLSAYSSAQGRVVAVLHLLPHSSGVMAILPRELALPTLERLRKFVLRAKVKIEDLSDQYSVAGAHDASALEPGLCPWPGLLTWSVRESPSRAWPMARKARRRATGWCVGASGVRGGVSGDTAELAWRLADIRAGMPQVYAATSEQFVAQMLNLDLLDAISFTKGCYTGQEIIARTQHLGRIKRRLSRLGCRRILVDRPTPAAHGRAHRSSHRGRAGRRGIRGARGAEPPGCDGRGRCRTLPRPER